MAFPRHTTWFELSRQIARAHVAWATTNGHSLAEILGTLGERHEGPIDKNYVISRVAAAWIDRISENQRRLGDA